MNDGPLPGREPGSKPNGAPAPADPHGNAAQRLLGEWQRGMQPDWLPFATEIPEDNWLELLTLLRVDQDQRWKHSRQTLIEEYVSRRPEIVADPEHLLDLVASELLLRRSNGQSPGVDEYCQRFPQHADALRTMWAQTAAFDNSLDRSQVTMLISDHQSDVKLADPGTLVWSASRVEREKESVVDDDLITLATARPASMANLPEFIGNYRLEGILGRGGMGVVYKARDKRLKRLVALKMLSSFDNPEEMQRFKSEAEIYARLQHPNIVQIFEVGQHEGRAFLALELVTGGSLAERLKGVPLPARQAAEIVATLTQAVHFGHVSGVVHRDLKPGNVLLTSDDTPKVTDFGLAKSIDTPSDQTQSGTLIGTPSYMAPEQACGDSKNAGPLVDVYALGSILYEALTGRPPFRGQTTLDTLDQVRSAEPVAPITLQPKMPRDLNTICLKCLEKSPDKRYASAKELGEDLKRFLNGEAIQARPVNQFERLMKWTRRRPAAAAMAATIAICITTLIIGGTLYSISLREALDTAQKATIEARTQRRAALDQKTLAEEREKEAKKQTKLAQQRADEAARVTMALQLNQVAALAKSDPVRGLQLLSDEATCPPALRDFTWRYLHNACSRVAWQTPIDGAAAARCLAVSPDGQLQAIGMDDGRVLITPAGQPQRTLKLPPGPIICLTFLPHSSKLAIGSSDGTIAICDLAEGDAISKLQETGEAVNAIAVSNDGKLLASGGPDQTVRIWDLANSKVQKTLAKEDGSIFALAFSPDDKQLAIGLKNDEAKIWNLTDDQTHTLSGHRGWVTSAAWSPDGSTLATGSIDRTIKIWNAVTCQPKDTLIGHDEIVRSLFWDRDSRTLYSSGYDKKAILWNTVDGTLRMILRSAGEEIVTIAPCEGAGQKQLLTMSGHALQAWRIDANIAQHKILAHTRPITAMAFVPQRAAEPSGKTPIAASGNVLITAAYDHTWRMWNPNTFQPIGEPHEVPQWITTMAVSPSGLLAMGDSDGAVHLFADLTKPPLSINAHELSISSLAFTADGKLVSCAAGEGEARVWDPADGKRLDVIRAPADAAFSLVAFDPPSTLVFATEAGEIWRHGIGKDSGKKPAEAISVDRGSLRALACSPIAATVATAHSDGHITLIDLEETPPLARKFGGHQGAALALAFTLRGQTLVSGGTDQNVRFWDLTIGHERLTVQLTRGDVTCIGFSSDGNIMSSGHNDGSIELWQATPEAGAGSGAK